MSFIRRSPVTWSCGCCARLSRSGAAGNAGLAAAVAGPHAAALVFGVFFLGVGGSAGAIAGLREANTDPGISLAATNAFIVIRFVLQQIPAVLSIRLLLLAMELAAALKKGEVWPRGCYGGGQAGGGM